MGALGVGLAVALSFVFHLDGKLAEERAESAKTIESYLKTVSLQAQQVEALDALATRVDRFNRDFGASLGRLRIDDGLEANLGELGKKTHLPEDAKKSLEELESTIAEIARLTEEAKELERYLGTPAQVKRGETHSAIARRFLIEEARLAAKEADEVLKRTALAWDVEPGNQVFNLYRDGVLLSTVTQGTAKRSPLMVQWSRRRAAAARLQELEDRVRELEARLAAVHQDDAAPVAPAPDGASAEAPDVP